MLQVSKHLKVSKDYWIGIRSFIGIISKHLREINITVLEIKVLLLGKLVNIN